MPENHEHFMRMALEEAETAKAEGNSAVGSVIVQDDGEIVALGRNLVDTTFDPTAHAETVAIRNAGGVREELDFTGCTLYTTFEPCPMCCGAIMASGISTIVMGGRLNPNRSSWGGYTVERLIELADRTNRVQVVTGILEQECADMLWQSQRRGA